MRHEETYPLEYVTGLAEFDRLSKDPSFLAFIGLIDDEGNHGLRDTIELSTGDAEDAALAAHWLRRLSGARVNYVLDVVAGDDVIENVRSWSQRLDVSHERLRLRRRRFDELGPRAFEPAPDGVITVRTTDPVLQIRMQAWIDKVRANLVRAAH
ncbi:MAG: hypothetical protein U0R24_04575 [Solirubrobacterales bacterium]